MAAPPVLRLKYSLSLSPPARSLPQDLSYCGCFFCIIPRREAWPGGRATDATGLPLSLFYLPISSCDRCSCGSLRVDLAGSRSLSPLSSN
eukprot:scaffold147830_cov19-Tisochrysis_lutea.AAC.1